MSNHRSTRLSWDPGTFKLGERPVSPGVRNVRRISTIGGKFIAGPVDVIWLSRARKLGVTALWVGLALWFLRGLRRSDSFVVSNLIMQEWDVRPDAKSRALRKLEKAGLITITQIGKRSPRVTLVKQCATSSEEHI